MKKRILIIASTATLLVMIILALAFHFGLLGDNHTTEVDKTQEPNDGKTLIYDNSGSFLKTIETDPASSAKSSSQ